MALVTVHGQPLCKEALSRKGTIQVIFGPMFSGKTTELIRRIKRYQIAKYKCLLIKYENDNRYDQFAVATHDRQVSAAVASSRLYDLKELALNYNVIGIDEGQFFPDTVKFSEEMANLGKTVVVAALDGTFQRKGFGNILELVPLAENVVKLSAVCMNCYGEGSFTKRLGSETELEIIGGTDKYMAACRLCHGKFLDDQVKISDLKKARNPLESIENTNFSMRQKLASGMSNSLFSL